jgi:hypothetical protein
MHRSGTSITSRLLDALGVDMGDDLTVNHESLAFALRNDTLLATAHARWDHPLPFVEAMEDPARFRTLVALATNLLDSPGWWLLQSCRYDHDLDRTAHWGWKDPRNSITWPVWLEVFPEARFVCVARDTEDVITSLVARTLKIRSTRQSHSTRSSSETGARSLAEEYAESLDRLTTAREPERLFDLSYERLIDDPNSVVKALANWIHADESKVAAAAGLVRRLPRPA